MDKITLTEKKWVDRRNLMQTIREETAMAGGTSGQAKGEVKRELSSMDAYISTIDVFIADIKKLK
jgi:hypothetical protein